jgi:hypothetical protein
MYYNSIVEIAAGEEEEEEEEEEGGEGREGYSLLCCWLRALPV